jgi:hypothetical protein
MPKSKERAAAIIAEHGDRSMRFMANRLSRAIKNDEPDEQVADLMKDMSNVRKQIRKTLAEG